MRCAEARGRERRLFPAPSRDTTPLRGTGNPPDPHSCSLTARFSNDPAPRSYPVRPLPVRALALAAFGLAALLTPGARSEQDLATAHWVKSTAYVVPKETATEGEGYFSIIEGHNGRLYIGTHANGVNSWLVEFDPETKKMTTVVDVHKAIGIDLKGFGSQAKIHTRNNVGMRTGKIYF